MPSGQMLPGARGGHKGKKTAGAKGTPGAKKPTKEQTAELMKVFEAYDANGDGSITESELGALMKKLNPAFDDAKCSLMMKEMDKKGSGGVDVEDFILWVMSQPPEKTDEVQAASKLAPPPGSGGLDDLIAEIFTCIDENQDGEIERVEMLTAEESRCKAGGFDFGVAQRKEFVAWFKGAGATGTPADGMFLSQDQFNAAIKAKAVAGAGVADKEIDQLKTWLEEFYKPLLDEARKPPPAPKAAGADGMPGPAGSPPPTYPLTIPYAALGARIAEANDHGKAVLILGSELEQVESYMNYQTCSTLDCKALAIRAFMKKEITKADASLEGKQKLTEAMKVHGTCQSLWLRLNSSAFDFVGNFSADDFPHEVFAGRESWTIAEAHKRGFFDDNHKSSIELEDEKKWKQFQVIMTSTFDLDKGKEHLTDKIPNWDKLAILHIDPKSI